ncbi:MAG TPA: transcriptional regulator [Geobacter sp.]|nr:transcriptional regulator [Geobacter sp.]
MAVKKIIDERCVLSRKKGNGQIRREVWTGEDGKVVRYNLAYINHTVFAGDNGRVVGYDNNHGSHHRHLMGQMFPVTFTSMEELEVRFCKEWKELMPAKKGPKKDLKC